MRDLLEIKEFYASSNSAILDCVLGICGEMISEPMIAKKIELGLALGPLLGLVARTTSRLKEIADQPVLQNSIPRKDMTLQNLKPENIADTAAALSKELKSHVLYDPDLPVLSQIAEIFPRSGPFVAAAADALPALPARDPSLRLDSDKPFRFLDGESIIARQTNYLGFLFYVLVDVEISAMEVCGYMAIKHRDMPDDFVLDMARQIWDEARHAAYVLKNYTELGGELGQFPYTNTVVDRYMSASNLLEGLIVQQVIQESNAVENNLALARDLAQAGRDEEALSFLVINNDEALHARIGFHWIEYLAAKNSWPSDYLFARTVFMCRKIGLPPFGMGTWSDIVRISIGSPEWLMNKKKYFGEFFSRGPAH